MLDVPRLLMREKAQRARRNGVTLQDRVLGEPQLLGQMTAGPMARVANLVNANRLVRKAHVRRRGHLGATSRCPPSARRASRGWLKHHEPLPEAGTRGTVALFATCLADYNFPRIAACAVRVLEKNGWSVVRPEQTCCGMPEPRRRRHRRRAGEGPRRTSRRSSREVERGAQDRQPAADVRVHDPQGVAGARSGTDDARKVAAATVDVMELLEQQRRDKTLVARVRARPRQGRVPRGVPPARAEDRLSRRCACSASCPTPRSRSSSSARPSTARGA